MNIDRSIFKTDKPYVYRRKNVGNYFGSLIRWGEPGWGESPWHQLNKGMTTERNLQ